MSMFAGKTRTNSAAQAQAAARRVRGMSNPTAQASSPTPLTRTQKAGEPRKRGTIDSNPLGDAKCHVPVVRSNAPSATAATVTRRRGFIVLMVLRATYVRGPDGSSSPWPSGSVDARGARQGVQVGVGERHLAYGGECGEAQHRLHSEAERDRVQRGRELRRVGPAQLAQARDTLEGESEIMRLVRTDL